MSWVGYNAGIKLRLVVFGIILTKIENELIGIVTDRKVICVFSLNLVVFSGGVTIRSHIFLELADSAVLSLKHSDPQLHAMSKTNANQKLIFIDFS